MTDTVPPGARASPSTARNRQPILEAIRGWIDGDARVLEVASGAGEHAVFLAAGMPGVIWQPSDRDDLGSIVAWREHGGVANVLPPTILDVTDAASWPAGPFQAVVCINMIHIAPWAACQGLMALAAEVLEPN